MQVDHNTKIILLKLEVLKHGIEHAIEMALRGQTRSVRQGVKYYQYLLDDGKLLISKEEEPDLREAIKCVILDFDKEIIKDFIPEIK